MKVLQLSTSDLGGGAARAAYRLHKQLRLLGVDSNMYVQEKLGDDQYIFGPNGKVEKGLSSIRPTLDLLPLYMLGKSDKTISSAWFPNRIYKRLSSVNADLIHLHWINRGFIQVSIMHHLSIPILWTFHDMWPFTGGCHYDLDCGRYMDQCGICPQIGSSRKSDISRWIWLRKTNAWQSKNICIVCPSKWMAECSAQSSLFAESRIEVIANGLDLARFRPIDRESARELIGLPQKKKLVLFSAIKGINNPHKGFKYIEPILYQLSTMMWKDKLELVVMGSSKPIDPQVESLPSHYLGHLNDEILLSIIYGAVDLLLVPSIQDNLPSTIMEAIACGTPCVAFNVGGISDVIDHQINGYLAEKFDVHDFAHGINWILENKERYSILSELARKKAIKDFDINKQATKYINFYNEVINTPSESLES
jgi:glycosyltransferase involved in cell wall biosynthesis